MSAEGAALQRLPPTVARFRIWTDPTRAALSAGAGYRARTPGSSSSVRAVTAAPTVRPPPFLGPRRRSGATPDRSTTQAGLSRLFLSWGRRSVPPATSFASDPRALSTRTHSSTLPGSSISNRRTRPPWNLPPTPGGRGAGEPFPPSLSDQPARVHALPPHRRG